MSQQDQYMGKPFTNSQVALAWTVHFFTASGIIAVFMALLEGIDRNFAGAIWWLLAAQVIDGIDGTFARLFKVTEVLPKVSGKNIDTVVDFAGYVIVPAFLIFQANVIDAPYNLWIALLILLTSAVYYGKEGMISEDLYFIGFPVMWNLVAFCLLFVFEWESTVSMSVIVVLAILQFVPIKFAYPSRTNRWRIGNITSAIVFTGASIGLLWFYPRQIPLFWWGCVLSLIYFGAFAILATFWFDRRQ